MSFVDYFRQTLKTTDEAIKSQIVDLKKLRMCFVDYFRLPSKSTDKHLKSRIVNLKNMKKISIN